MSRLVFALALIALASPLAAADAQELQGLQGRTFTFSERIAAGGWLRVFNFNGRIEVVEGTGDAVQVTADKDMSERYYGEVGFEVRRAGDGITICAMIAERSRCEDDAVRQRGSWDDDDWDNGRRRRVNIRIAMPKGVHLRAKTGNGDVSARGTGGQLELSTGNGEVEVIGTTGSVRANTGNGEMRIERAGGAVDARTGNGRVYVSTSTGPVSVSTGNGEIDVAMDRLEGTGDMEFRTGNGDVTVTLPASIDADFEMRTGHGSVSTDFPVTVNGRLNPRQLRGTVGKGGRRLHVSSGNGDIDLRKRGG
jgi:hypothetical protein